MTNDEGYIMTMHRIPTGISEEEPFTEDRPPILLCHGMFSGSDAFVAHGPEESPAFFYANHGYDVWLLNHRGNRYSKNHTTLDPDTDMDFWRFTMTDLSRDTRVFVEYVMNHTQYNTIAMFTISMSTTVTFIAITDDTEFYQEHCSLLVAAGAIGKFTDMHSTTLTPVLALRWILPLLRSYGVYEFGALNYLQSDLTQFVCQFVSYY